MLKVRNHRDASKFKQHVLVCETAEVIFKSVSCLLSETSLLVQNSIEVLDSFLIEFLKTVKELIFRLKVDLRISEQKPEEGIDLSFAFALIPNNLVASGRRDFFRLHNQTRCYDLTAE